MENQEVNQNQVEDISNWSFVSDEEAANGLNDGQPVQETYQPQEDGQQEQQAVESEESEFDAILGDDVQENNNEEGSEYSDEDIELAVAQYISDRLGVSINSIEEIQSVFGSSAIDERIKAIADFVSETGRDPSDWFAYQQLDPSRMDDLTAIQVQFATDYPNLSQEEIQTLVSNKYKLDEDVFSEDEVRLSKLQMKIDAENARKTVEQYRSKYRAPESERSSDDDYELSKEWIEDMGRNLDALQGVEFDLGNGNSFKFGLSNQYKNSLYDRNARLDEYFDPYVREDGSWDYDTLNIHRAVVDNIDSIVQSVYRQGLADGQKGIVNQAANVQVQTPSQSGNQNQADPLSAQLREAILGNQNWSF
jgi:hypothetical protein